MSAGKRDCHVELQSRIDSVDEIGQPSTSWLTVANPWVDIKYLNGLSAIKSGADTSISKVSIRALRGTFNAGQRIVYGNEIFDIQSVQPQSRFEVDLVCGVVNADV